MDIKTEPKEVLQAFTITLADLKDEIGEWRPLIDRLRAQLAKTERTEEDEHAATVMALEDQIDGLRARVLFWARTAGFFLAISLMFLALHIAGR